jgi:hypothetical protein
VGAFRFRTTGRGTTRLSFGPNTPIKRQRPRDPRRCSPTTSDPLRGFQRRCAPLHSTPCSTFGPVRPETTCTCSDSRDEGRPANRLSCAQKQMCG